MRTITAKELKHQMDSGAPLTLINALEENKFRMKHIPHSLNYFRREDIEKNCRKDETIVVYCTDSSCNKSIILYQLLDAIGYKNVFRFPGGMNEWEKEGFETEGEMLH